MQAEEVLARLTNVRRTSRGWTACCPAHADKSPSLSVQEGERGLLLRCWAGCTIEEICAALGIQVADLFFDSHVDPGRKRQRDTERLERERQRVQDGLRIDVLREAEATIAAAHGIDISKWSDDQLDVALNQLADAYAILEAEHGA